MDPDDRKVGVHCSFCAKGQLEVAKLVAGPGVFICNECIELSHQIVTEELLETEPTATGSDPTGSAEVPPPIRAWDGLSDDELLGEMVRAHGAHRNVDRAVARHVTELRGRGVTWARIGEALGMTRQSAWERFSGEE